MNKYYITTEREELFDVNMMVVISIDIISLLNKDDIVDAFHCAVNAHEILTMRVVIDEDGTAYYEKCEENKNRIWFCEQYIEDIIYEQERIRFEIESGEFIRAAINYCSEKCTVTFLMHHLGGDGKSLIYFVESIMQALDKQKPAFVPIRHLSEENIPADSGLSFIYRKFVESFNKCWKKERKVFSIDDMKCAFNQFWNHHKTHIEIKTVEEKELLEMKNECHQNSIGITSYLIADFIKDSDNKHHIGIAADARLDGNRSMGNQVTGISVSYRYNKKNDLIANATRINDAMKKKLKDKRNRFFVLHLMAAFDGTLIDALSPEYAKAFTSKVSKKLAFILEYGERKSDLSITNLTAVDIAIQYGNLCIDKIIFIPPVVSYGKNIVGIVTANNKMVITKHYYDN